MQKHVLMDVTSQIEITYNQKLDSQLIVLYYPQIKESNHPITQALEYYLKSKELVSDINQGKWVKIYSYNETDPFKSLQIVQSNSPREDGAQIAKKISNRVSKQADNKVQVLLPHNYSLSDLIEFEYGFQLGNYRWTYQTIKIGGKSSSFPVSSLNLLIEDTVLEQQNTISNNWKLKIQKYLPKAILRVREIVPTRPNIATTDYIYKYLSEMVSQFGNSVETKFICGDNLLLNNLRLIHAVGRGSIHKPFLACFAYKGKPDDQNYFALIGKGVVFDSGGLCVKSGSSMEQMYDDKAGACTVVETFKAIVELGLPINVVCTTAWVENSIGPDAYRVSDVLQSYKGITVEVLNTDAEGRLILADAMSYTQNNYNISDMIELSTLTGTIKNALGRMCGVFTNRKTSMKLLKRVQKITKEPFWQLPLEDEHRDLIKGNVADINNSSGGKVGASAAAAFLEQFVESKTRWMHWDIANVAVTDKSEGTNTRGATGFGVSSLIYFMAWDLLNVETVQNNDQ